MPAIGNVVFDIGNVLIRWNPRGLYEELIPDAAKREWFLAHVCTDAWNREADRGRPFARGVAELTAQYPEWGREIRAWDERWHDMVPGAIEGSVRLLEGLRAAGVPVWSITNFSREKYPEAVARFPFLAGFRDTVVSAHEGLLKPDPAIYRVLIDRNRLDPASCLFIDDLPENVEGARSIGMQGVVFTSPEQLAADLASFGLAP